MLGAFGQGGRRLSPARAMLAISAVAAVVHAGPAAAQAPQAQPTAAPASSRGPCELHVWPAATTHTTFQGWVRAGTIDGARRGKKGYPDLHADALDTAEQARLLATIDWKSAFDDPNLSVTIHDKPTGSADDRGRIERLAGAGSATCYREIIIGSSIVESEVFSKQSVRILALRKRYDGAGAAPVNFSSMSQAPIPFTEADKAAADADARMDAAVKAAFVSAATKFAVMQSFH